MKKTLIAVLSLVIALGAAQAFTEDMSAGDLLAEAQAQILQVPVDVAKLVFDTGDYLFIDIREPNETEMGFIPGAVLIPRGLLEFRIASAAPDKNTSIVVYCKSGGRAALAVYTLKRMGYTNVINMAGGFSAWDEKGYPVDE